MPTRDRMKPRNSTTKPFPLMPPLPTIPPFKFLLAAALGLLLGVSRADDRPNVLLILADDLGYSDLSCYGSEIPTPHLDRLARGGARFNAFYTSARCCPSRASLLTGLHPHEAGIGSFAQAKPRQGWGKAYTGHLLADTATLAEILGDAGYSTWMVGKWHMGTPGPIARGFQHYYGYRRFLSHSENQWDPGHYVRLPEGTTPEIKLPRGEFYATDVFNDYALEFLRQARSGPAASKPWFLYLAHSSPHFPVQAPVASIERHLETYRRGWDVLRAERLERQKKLGLVSSGTTLPPRAEVPVDREDIANGFPGQENPAWNSLPADRREDLARRMATFAAMVEHIDLGIGNIIADLEEHGELDNTLILFLSDNGACYEWGPFGFDGPSRKGLTTLHRGPELKKIGQDHTHQSYGSAWANLGNTPLSMYKHFCHEGGLASPLVVHWPKGVPPHKGFVRTPSHLMDIVPTVCEATGIPYPEERKGTAIQPVSGTSLLPALKGATLPERPLAFEHQGARGLRLGDWKLVWGKRQVEEVSWELYNLRTDRSEQHNLADKEPAKLQELVTAWEEWARKVGANPFLNPGKPGQTTPPRPHGGAKKAASTPAPPADHSRPSAPRPLFADPHYNGSCDPEVVWNEAAKEWFIYYTARRASRKTGTYVGTPLGVISSPDLIHWTFRGYCSFDGKKGLPDNADTHWAPGVIAADGQLHMFATYKDNATPPWGGKGVIRHYVAPLDDPVHGWKLAGIPGFQQPDPIDASLIRVGDTFRAYYRVGNGGGLQWASSPDLVTWTNHGKCPGDVNAKNRGFGYQEAPYVFQFGGFFWMLTDPHDGLAVFRSDDGITWQQKPRLLREPGRGPEDHTRARHPSVAVVGDRAFIFYHVEPNRPYPSPPAEKRTPHQKKSFLQVAELRIENGELACDRNQPVTLPSSLPPRWSAQRARDWYEGVAWPVGANFVPSTAINPLEMWQADTFDPETIDRELGWAAASGMNTMRVFLHDLAWKQDPEGFLERVDRYLAISDKHGISTMLVFFDGVWNPYPKAGKQPAPVPRVHNSGWIQSPGRKFLDDPALQESLKPYVQSVVTRFKDDPRVQIWDLFNEPDNGNGGNFGGGSREPDLSPALKKQRAYELLFRTFQWVREINPSQPLTVGVWGGPNWLDRPDYIERLSLEQSDLISFHTYNGPKDTKRMVEGLTRHHRPILCTEYMARGNNSTFAGILPIFHQHKVGAYNWGLVDGKSQTIYPWNSWKKTYTEEPDPWFHDVFRRDGTPYDPAETKLIRRLRDQP